MILFLNIKLSIFFERYDFEFIFNTLLRVLNMNAIHLQMKYLIINDYKLLLNGF